MLILIIKFWEKMGFRIFERDNNYYANLILDYSFNIPSGKEVKVITSSFRDEKRYDNNIEPLSVQSPHAIKDKDGRILFEK